MRVRPLAAALATVAFLGLGACRSTVPRLGAGQAAAALDALGGPLDAHPVALYRVEAPRARGLRLSLQTAEEGGRLAVSEPFGSALSILAWDADGAAVAYDLGQGCRLADVGLEEVLGIEALPVQAVVRLLGGRLPAAGSQTVLRHGRLLAAGSGWSAVVAVLPDPWRVVDVRAGDGSWRIRLLEHDGAVPTRLTAGRGALRRVELELVAMEWDTLEVLPPAPDLPPCGG